VVLVTGLVAGVVASAVVVCGVVVAYVEVVSIVAVAPLVASPRVSYIQETVAVVCNRLHSGCTSSYHCGQSLWMVEVYLFR